MALIFNVSTFLQLFWLTLWTIMWETKSLMKTLNDKTIRLCFFTATISCISAYPAMTKSFSHIFIWNRNSFWITKWLDWLSFSQRLSVVFQHETVDGKLEIVPYNLNHKICAHFNVCALTILKKDLGVLSILVCNDFMDLMDLVLMDYKDLPAASLPQVHCPRISYKSKVMVFWSINPSTSPFSLSGKILINVFEANRYLALFLWSPWGMSRNRLWPVK